MGRREGEWQGPAVRRMSAARQPYNRPDGATVMARERVRPEPSRLQNARREEAPECPRRSRATRHAFAPATERTNAEECPVLTRSFSWQQWLRAPFTQSGAQRPGRYRRTYNAMWHHACKSIWSRQVRLGSGAPSVGRTAEYPSHNRVEPG